MKNLTKIASALIMGIGILSSQAYSQEIIKNLNDRGLFCQTEDPVTKKDGAHAFNKVYFNPVVENYKRTIDVNPELSTLRNLNCSGILDGVYLVGQELRWLEGKYGTECTANIVDPDNMITTLGTTRIVIDYTATDRRGGEDIVYAKIYSNIKRTSILRYIDSHDSEVEDAYCEVYSLEMTQNIAKSKK